MPEAQLDAVTGLSGSGPAFVYTMIELLAAGRRRDGIAGRVGGELAAHTVAGAAEMVLATGETPAVLRERVTSPGGTTLAGLKALEENGFRRAVIAAVRAATAAECRIGKIVLRIVDHVDLLSHRRQEYSALPRDVGLRDAAFLRRRGLRPRRLLRDPARAGRVVWGSVEERDKMLESLEAWHGEMDLPEDDQEEEW